MSLGKIIVMRVPEGEKEGLESLGAMVAVSMFLESKGLPSWDALAESARLVDLDAMSDRFRKGNTEGVVGELVMAEKLYNQALADVGGGE